MAIQHRINSITDNEDGTVTFQIGPYGITKDKMWLFDRSAFSHTHMLKNLRISHAVGGRPDIASREFLDAVNSGARGMELGDKTWFIKWVRLVDAASETYAVNFSENRNGPDGPYTLEISRLDIEVEPTGNPEEILDNVRSFLRVGGFTDLTQPAIAQLTAPGRAFWA